MEVTSQTLNHQITKRGRQEATPLLRSMGVELGLGGAISTAEAWNHDSQCGETQLRQLGYLALPPQWVGALTTTDPQHGSRLK